MNPPRLTVVELPVGEVANVPRMLRRLADDIEKDDYGDVDACAVVLSGEALTTFGFGSVANSDRVVMMLEAGKATMLRTFLDKYEDG